MSEESDADSHQALGHQMESNQLLRLQVDELQKRLADKENKLAEANELIRALRDEVQTLQQQLEHQRRKYQDIIGQSQCAQENNGITTLICVNPCMQTGTCASDCLPNDQESDCTAAEGSTQRSHEDQDVTAQNPQPSAPLETSCALRTEIHVSPPNLLLSCTSEDEPADPPASLSDGTVMLSQPMLSLRMVSVKLEDCCQMLGPDGVFKTHTEEDKLCDEGNYDYDAHGDSDYDPTTEGLDSCSKDGDTSSAPEEQGNDQSEQRRHSCSECSQTFPKLKCLRVHQRCHGKKSSPLQRAREPKAQRHRKPHECTECGEVFPFLSRLLAHQKRHCRVKTGNTKTACVKSHKCSECGKAFSLPSQLSVHQRVHVRKKPFTGALCEKTFTDSSNFERVEGEAEKIPEPCKESLKKPQKSNECEVCGKILSTFGNLNIHKKIHTGERPFACSQCHKTFTQLGNLREHQRRHTQERPYWCSLCPKKFITSSVLKIHMRKHTGERPYLCIQCGKSFTCLSSLKSHRKTHMGELPYECSLCKKRFGFTVNLRAHERVHTGEKPHLCQYCGRAFRTSAQMVQHQRSHTGEKPYKCSQCEKSFATVSVLKNHTLRHTGERPHLCPVCGKAFSRMDTLKTHQRTHTGEKPYHCALCGEKFSYIQSLQSHQKREHTVS